MPVRLQHHVRRDAQTRRDPGSEPVLRNVRDSRVDSCPRVARVRDAALDPDFARGRMTHPADRLRELSLPVPGDAGDGQDLAGPNRERHVLQGRFPAIALGAEALDLEHDLAEGGPVALGSPRRLDLSPDHQARELLQRRVGDRDRRHRLAASEDRDAVGDRHHLVQLVRDEDDRPPVRGHLSQRLEEDARLLRRQHRGRLVEDQDPRVTVERLHDLDPLLLAERELPDPCTWVDAEPVTLAELRDALLDRARMDEERAADVSAVAEDDVLRDRERRNQAEMLVHHADSGVERLAR